MIYYLRVDMVLRYKGSKSRCKINFFSLILQSNCPMMQRLEKNYYRIREVAEILGIPVTTLRFWEKQFTIIKPRRTTSGQRLYTPADIDKVAMICYLVRDKGMRLDAAEEQLRSNPKGVERGSRALMRLRVVRAELAEMIKAIR